MLKDILPNNSFLNHDDELNLISGKKFEKACKRSQANKSDTFGVELKVGLYREARHGGGGQMSRALPTGHVLLTVMLFAGI